MEDVHENKPNPQNPLKISQIPVNSPPPSPPPPLLDPLDAFLPPPPTTNCSDLLQEKITKFISFKTHWKSFNQELRKRKDYRNPDFLVHAVRYQDIDEIGSCFSKDVFDPHGYDKSDFVDELEAEIERKEKERIIRNNKKSRWDYSNNGDALSVAAAQAAVMAAAIAQQQRRR